MTAAITSHVLGRVANRRYPVHLFIDEAQFFCSPAIAEILGESRKFGLYATLATQRLDSLDRSLQDATLGNVGNIWVGGSRSATVERIARDTDIAADTIRQLPNMIFLHAVNGREARRQMLLFIGDRCAMSPAKWALMQKLQALRYYRPVKSADHRTL